MSSKPGHSLGLAFLPLYLGFANAQLNVAAGLGLGLNLLPSMWTVTVEVVC